MTRCAEHLPQAHVRQRLAAQTDDPDFVARDLVGGKLHAFTDHLQWNDVGFVVGDDRKSIDDGQSEWQANGNGRALAFGALDLDLAPQEFDIAANYIHADA